MINKYKIIKFKSKYKKVWIINKLRFGNRIMNCKFFNKTNWIKKEFIFYLERKNEKVKGSFVEIDWVKVDRVVIYFKNDHLRIALK